MQLQAGVVTGSLCLGLAKYDSSKISRFLGIWLDLFLYGDSPRKDYRLGKDQFQNELAGVYD